MGSNSRAQKEAQVDTAPAHETFPASCVPPCQVGPGSRVGIAALSGPVRPDCLARGTAALASMGFDVVLADNVKSRCGFLAGTDDERLSAFHRLLESDVDAVVFARGGHGVLRILDRIDWALVSARRRWFVGYSDLTPFLLETVRRTGWMALHGPMVASDLHRPLWSEERDTFLAALAGSYKVNWRVSKAGAGPDERTRIGTIFGGCLSMICATLGTFASPQAFLNNNVVFLEDVGEPPYKIDRFLAQLGMAGLGDAKAVVFGHCGEGEDSASTAKSADAATLDKAVIEVLGDHSERLGIPFYYGLRVGHGIPNLSLPLGAQACIRDGTLSVSMVPRERPQGTLEEQRLNGTTEA